MYTTDTIFMIRPNHFGYNEETAENNTFQSLDGDENWIEISAKARAEFDAFAAKLLDYDIDVNVFEDQTDVICPDAIFPNNWITAHHDGTLVTFPMFSKKRRHERREDILVALEEKYKFEKRYSFDYYEEKNMYLEGTGSMIIDRKHKMIYACLSERTNIQILEKYAVLMGYRKTIFHAFSNDTAIYHTNVMMSLGQQFAMLGLSTIPDEDEQKNLVKTLEDSGKEIITLSQEQINSFAGNAIELMSKNGKSYKIMSEQAFKSLELGQIRSIEKYSEILYAPLYTIEKYGGGSARCMIAEIFYPN